MFIHIFSLLVAMTWGQTLPIDRPIFPGSSVSGEDGPSQAWTNPALLSYQQGLHYGLFANRTFTDEGAQSFAAAASWGGLGLNLSMMDDETRSRRWSAGASTSLSLPYRLSLGLNARWHLSSSEQNYMAYDAGLAWRPLPWFGIGAVAYNIGNPNPMSPSMSSVGLAIRPFWDRATIGIDYTHNFAGPNRDFITLTGRFQPIDGLAFRGSLNSEADFGVGLEWTIQGTTIGVIGQQQTDRLTGSAWLANTNPDQNLFRNKNALPVFVLKGTPPNQPSQFLFSPSKTSWTELLGQIRKLRKRKGLRGAVISLDGLDISWAQSEELRDEIELARADGKYISVYLNETASTANYWVASSANFVAMHPAGQLNFLGVSRTLWTSSKLFETLGVSFKVVRRSEYKSAVEQNINTQPSQAALEQTQSLLKQRYNAVTKDISDARSLSIGDVEKLIDLAPLSPSAAKKAGLIDAILYPDQLKDSISKKLDRNIQFREPQKATSNKTWESPKTIALIVIEGMILSGQSIRNPIFGPSATGSSTVCRQLEKAASSSEVEAIVIRVDSPGGSAFASDEIWRCLTKAKESNKPVVVSMGGVAASGGYYVSAPADAIWAEPTTVTGSIGIYIMIPTFHGLLDDLGANRTTVKFGDNADIYSNTSDWSDKQLSHMNTLIEESYQTFKERVASGRRLEAEQVESLAKGRVWSGEDALENGLVDRLGSFNEAVEDAKRRAGITEKTDVSLVIYDETSWPTLLGPQNWLGAVVHSTSKSRRTVEIPSHLQQIITPLATLDILQKNRVWMLAPWYPLETTP